MFIDCVTHALTGPAILRAVGIQADGSSTDTDEQGYPKPVILVLRIGGVQNKINTIRVAISQESKTSGVSRMFELMFNNPIESQWTFGDRQEMVALVGMYFAPGGLKKQSAFVLHNMLKKESKL